MAGRLRDGGVMSELRYLGYRHIRRHLRKVVIDIIAKRGPIPRCKLIVEIIPHAPPEIYMKKFVAYCLIQSRYFGKRTGHPYNCGRDAKTLEDKIWVGAEVIIGQLLYQMRKGGIIYKTESGWASKINERA